MSATEKYGASTYRAKENRSIEETCFIDLHWHDNLKGVLPVLLHVLYEEPDAIRPPPMLNADHAAI